MSNGQIQANGFVLQDYPLIYSAMLPGDWLLDHSTPSWRIEDPHKGFQRVVKERRAREIAVSVLEQQRTFPNAIILATDIKTFELIDCKIIIPDKIKFLVVDGQHRLWSQHFSSFVANYSCLIHTGLSEVEMAKLFLEINDNQKRVPTSLRWDLIRLVKPEDDPYGIAATEIIYSLATEEESPLYQRIDLTGEQAEITIKQGSLAPEIKSLVSSRSPFNKMSLDDQYEVITHFFIAIKNLDVDGWINADSPFYANRIIRALLQLLRRDISLKTEKELNELRSDDFSIYLEKIDPEMLSPERLRGVQGGAGISAIYKEMKSQVFQ